MSLADKIKQESLWSPKQEIKEKLMTSTKLNQPIQDLPAHPLTNPDCKSFADPRQDLKEDGWLWVLLLSNAFDMDKQLYRNLHGFRCMGTRVRKNDKGNFVLRPDINENCWSTQQQYEKERDRWLRPYTEQIKLLLKSLWEWNTQNSPSLSKS